MAFDPIRGVTVMYGGEYEAGAMYEWDGTQWTKVSSGYRGHAWHAMAFDPGTGELVVTGYSRAHVTWGTMSWDGIVWKGLSEDGLFSFPIVFFDDRQGALRGINDGMLWQFNGDEWTLLGTDHTVDRRGSVAAYDSNLGEAVLAGGHRSGVIYSGTSVLRGRPCYADCDQSTGACVLDIFDFVCFQNAFVKGEAYACECDKSSVNVCDVFDFLCFQNAFVAGCP